MSEISIIVPVYNVEQYLKKCLDSILAQTFTDFELLLIDDGSTDSSGIICDEYEKKDARIKVYHKVNGGLSSARNFGIEKADTPYLGFIDGDDYIDTDMYEILYKNIKTENADISMCALFDIYNGKPLKINKQTQYIVADAPEAIRIVMEAKINSVNAVNKLYKRELFHTVRYPEGKIAEDAFVIIELLMLTNKNVITTEQKYYYIHRKNSITTSKFKIKDCEVIEAYNKNYGLIKKNYPQLLDVAQMRLCWAHFYVLDKMMTAESMNEFEMERNVIGYLKKNFIFILKDKCFNKSRKIAMCLLMIHKELYRLCVKEKLRRQNL